jgi:hypothetical protein
MLRTKHCWVTFKSPFVSAGVSVGRITCAALNVESLKLQYKHSGYKALQVVSRPNSIEMDWVDYLGDFVAIRRERGWNKHNGYTVNVVRRAIRFDT